MKVAEEMNAIERKIACLYMASASTHLEGQAKAAQFLTRKAAKLEKGGRKGPATSLGLPRPKSR